MTPGHGGWQGCALEGSRVCARTSHTSPMYIVAACPVPSLPTRHLVFPRNPVPSLSLSPVHFSVRDLPAMESASRRVLRSRITETPLATPPAGPSTAMPSAGTLSTAMPSAGTPATVTPSADSPLAPKAEPDVPPGPTVAPSHYVASPPPTGDVSEPQLAPAVTTGADDTSEQVYIRVSVDALAEMEALAHAPPQTLDPASKSRLA